jgi:hypothetical protein
MLLNAVKFERVIATDQYGPVIDSCFISYRNAFTFYQTPLLYIMPYTMMLDILFPVEVHWNRLGVSTPSLSLCNDRNENDLKGTASNI